LSIIANKLIILDYSGTLSLEAPLLAEPGALLEQLAASGLKDFGIDAPRVFWQEIVNPTWKEGSTTAAGYKKVLSDRVIALLPPDMSLSRRAALAKAAAAFVDHYMAGSRIDFRWKPVLKKILEAPSVMPVIATDHYAEATDAMIHHLSECDIPSMSVMDAKPQRACFIVANSADIGFHKDDPRFWRTLHTSLCLHAVRSVLILDDFGYNEQEADAYAERKNIEHRMKTTLMAIESVFSAVVEVLPVKIGAKALRQGDRFERLVEQAMFTIDSFLGSDRS
jgi:hypothetical protein